MSKNDNIQVGVVGLGPRSRSWIPLLQMLPGSRVVALCDKRRPLLEKAIAENTEIEVAGYTGYNELLEHPGLDAVVILTDATTQTDLAVRAMEAGKHVTTEVPMCYTIEDCWKLVLAVERTGCIYQLGEQARYWGFVQAWKKLVASGQLGKILYVEGEYVGFYGTNFLFQDEETGQLFSAEEALHNPRAQKTWRHNAHPIGYLPHELSPMLSVLNDRVIEVTAMATRPRSYSFANVEQSDVEVALMKTEKDTILRMMAGFASPVGKRGETNHHWYQVRGTKGAVEWKRAGWDKPKMWLHDQQMTDWLAMPWSTAVVDAPPEALASGHGGVDYYAVATWLDAIANNTTPPLDVYQSVETAAPAAAAIESIKRGSALVKVPDFRPCAERAVGEEPASFGFDA